MFKNACFSVALLASALVTPDVWALTSVDVTVGKLEHDGVIVNNLSAGLHRLNSNPQLVLAGDILQDSRDVIKVELKCADFKLSPLSLMMECMHGEARHHLFKLPFSMRLNTDYQQYAGQLSILDGSFADLSGQHAGEKLNVVLDYNLRNEPNGLSWESNLKWTGGEIFWQPFYVTGNGHQIRANGRLHGSSLSINRAVIDWNKLGNVEFSTQYDLKTRTVIGLQADARRLDIAQVYSVLLKPMLDKTLLSDMKMRGTAEASLKMGASVEAFELKLHDADFADKQGRFGFYGVNADIPWDYETPQAISLAYEKGNLLRIPLGKTNLQAQVNRYSLTAPRLEAPILDGKLRVDNVSAAWINKQWYWHLGAALEGVTMPAFSEAMNWPQMSGKVIANIPLVTYRNTSINTEGEMHFRVFNGDILVNHLSLDHPLGALPVLRADMKFRNLDLGELTRTFSFGGIEGKLDGDLESLEMENWKPINFDASFRSSPGDYRKKISQRAVENISALGGAGAAAAIQRSFLRFLEQFNYQTIALSCKLRGKVCEMGGVESTGGGYIIVKGSGIPAITVMGYNRTVGWSELLARIKRVTDGNSQAVIK